MAFPEQLLEEELQEANGCGAGAAHRLAPQPRAEKPPATLLPHRERRHVLWDLSKRCTSELGRGGLLAI